jgi:gliding motility-associated-like protein
MLKLKFLSVLLGIFAHSMAFGFSFVVTPTTETCLGNGTLSFSVSNPSPTGSIEYFIYKLPNTSVPYASTTSNSLGGLTAGDYRVVAIETIGSATTTQQQEVTIADAVVPLEFTVQSVNQACAAVSNISVAVTSGTAVSYEIFDGPVTFPSQTSNLFGNLPVGVYKIRVFDACGVGVVSTFTVTLNPTGLSVGQPVFTSTLPPSCSTVVATQTLAPNPGTVIAYPLTVQYTVHPPNGDPLITINQTINSGDPQSQSLVVTLPTYPNQQYQYDLNISDACNTVTANSFVSNQDIDLRPTIVSLVCNTNYLGFKAVNFTPPYTLNFSAFPAGFDPAVANTSYPGPFTDAELAFGDDDHPVPLGTYTATILDACGKSKTIIFEVLDVPPVPQIIATHNGCLANTGRIVIGVPNYKLATAIVTVAPESYPFALPHDVSGLIDSEGILVLDPVALGDYTIAVTDFCASVISPIEVSIAAYVNQPLIYDLRPGCALQRSSLKLASGNASGLIGVTITAAPTGFPFALPYNGTTNITSEGAFYLDDLPAGIYEITATDACNFTNSATINVTGYAVTASNFSLQTNCGTFDLLLDFVSNGTFGETFWLQKALTGAINGWGHPLTENPYTENSLPDDTNSYRVNNNATNFNLAFNGDFRIVRSFFSYNKGSAINTSAAIDKNCIEILQPTLHFEESLEIVDAHRMPCSVTGNLDVIVDVNGALPLHFTITEKDGIPFAFDNGTSNVFSNLDAAVYTFQVEDNCGNIVNRLFDVGALGSLVAINEPDDMLECVTTVTNNETFDLSVQTSVILGGQSPTDYTLAYYTSAADAQANVNPITNLMTHNPPANPQTVYATVRFNALPNCYELTSFELFAGQTPTIDLNESYLGCDDNPVTVNAVGNNLPTTTYLWSNGSTDAEVSITQPGITNLTVTATNVYGNLNCSVTKAIEVIISVPPKIDRIDTVDWTDDENSISVVSATPEQFEYSLDGSDFQSENIFVYLEPGLYTVSIRDKFGCGQITKEVWLLNYPKFFTPNGDGYHDLWSIENAENESKFSVEIFDRYGKLLKVLHKGEGWDGRYNGREIFSDDYWFVAHRQDGKIFKGHFTLKR